MPRSILISLIVVLPLILAGCGSAEPSEAGPADVQVRIEKPVYSFALDSSVGSAVHNRGERPIYVPMGEYVHIEQWSDNGWIYRGPWFFVDGYGPSFAVAAGDSLVPPAMNLSYLNRAGTYRFVFRLWLHPRGRWHVPEENRVSPPFTVNWE
jgi:hypothetical protein